MLPVLNEEEAAAEGKKTTEEKGQRPPQEKENEHSPQKDIYYKHSFPIRLFYFI